MAAISQVREHNYYYLASQPHLKHLWGVDWCRGIVFTLSCIYLPQRNLIHPPVVALGTGVYLPPRYDRQSRPFV